MDFEGAQKYIIKRLKKELNPDLKYHSLDHTLDVCKASVVLAKMEGVSGKNLLLIKTAALYHDAGLLIKYKEHETISCLIVKEVLPRFNFKTKDINLICGMIMATRIPQQPYNLYDKILCDADLDYMGRDDFFMNAIRLKHEWMNYGIITTLKQWYHIQIDFLEKHRFLTNSAIKLRQEKKMLHLAQIKELLSM